MKGAAQDGNTEARRTEPQQDLALAQTHSDLGDWAKRHVRGRARELLAMATAGQPPSAAEVEALDRLAELATRADVGRAHAVRKWMLILAAAVVLIVLCAATIPVPTVGLHLEMTATDLHMHSAAQRMLTGRISVTELTVVSADVVRAALSSDPQIASVIGKSDLRLRAGRSGFIDLQDIVVPRGAEFSLTKTGDQRVTVEIGPGLPGDGPDRGIRHIPVSVMGVIDIGALARVKTRSALEILSSSGPLELELLPRRMPLLLEAVLPVDGLSVMRMDEQALPDKNMVALVSTVVSGLVSVPSLNVQHQLREGDSIRLEGVRGVVQGLSFQKDGIRFRFSGEVKRAWMGPDDGRISLVPSCLAWLAAQRPLALLWTAVTFLFSAGLAALRWWSKPK